MPKPLKNTGQQADCDRKYRTQQQDGTDAAIENQHAECTAQPVCLYSAE